MSASPVMLACAAVAVLCGVPVLLAAGLIDADRRAAGAADAASLAAADALAGRLEGEPCAVAARVAAAAGATLIECLSEPASGEARVRIEIETALGVAGSRARAGPP